jgi:hypothetical protein
VGGGSNFKDIYFGQKIWLVYLKYKNFNDLLGQQIDIFNFLESGSPSKVDIFIFKGSVVY